MTSETATSTVQSAPETAPSTVMMVSPEPRVPTTESFFGNRTKFCASHNTCQLYFAQKVIFVISLLQREPQKWAFRLQVDYPQLFI